MKAICDSCGRTIGLFNRNLLGQTQVCLTCIRTAREAKEAARRESAEVATKRLLHSLEIAGLLRRAWVGASRGTLLGFLVPLLVLLSASGGARGDSSLLPNGSRRITVLVILVLAVAGAAGRWFFGGWLGGLLSAWGAAILLGTVLGLREGLRGEWGWLA